MRWKKSTLYILPLSKHLTIVTIYSSALYFAMLEGVIRRLR